MYSSYDAFGIGVLIYCIVVLAVSAGLGFIPATIAKNKGYSFGLWWLYGWLLFIIALIHALVRYPGMKFVLISPEELRLPGYIRHDVLEKNQVPYEEVVRLEEAIPNLDLLYMTRVQKERFFNEEDYVRMKDFYILDAKKMKLAKDDMYVLLPLPRVNEISTEVDSDPRAAYFKQMQYGVYVRMALILTLLEIEV